MEERGENKMRNHDWGVRGKEGRKGG